MKLGIKVLIFISTILLTATLFIYSIINDNYKSIINFENKLIKNNMKNLIDNIDLSSEAITNILEVYRYDSNILDILNSNTSEDFQNLFTRDNFTHLFLLDENKKIIKGGIYNRNSEEFYYINQKSNFFNTNKNFLRKDQIYFTTYEFEKIIFNAVKIDQNSLNFKYIVIGKSIDSKFLSLIARLSDSYISIYFDYDFKNKYEINNSNNRFYYDIDRRDNNTLFSSLKLTDFLTQKDFYLSMKIDRLYFSKIMKNNKTIFYIFVASILFLLLCSYIFISKFFTNRIEEITNTVKNVSKNKKLNTKIKMTYNDEITYLANKINDMLTSIDISQHENLKKERDFLQSVIDAQQSIILITDGNDIKSTNKRFNDHFDSKELFLTNLALLDQKAHNNFIEIVKNYDSYEKPAKIKVSDNKDGYFIFDIKKIDLKNYIINMNDVSKINKDFTNLKYKANFDELTGVFNKSSIISIGNEWFKYKNFSTIILDIDHFKKINDSFGHIYGDYILRDCCNLIKHNLRHFDVIGRFGGEEFIILIENVDYGVIKNICENLRKKIAQYEFKYDNTSINITISFGFTNSIIHKNFNECFKAADKALYKAKNNGRNQVCSC